MGEKEKHSETVRRESERERKIEGSKELTSDVNDDLHVQGMVAGND